MTQTSNGLLNQHDKGSSKVFPRGKLTVIVPSYNEEISICTTLQSLCNENALAESEIIIVDDGSTDRTCEIVKEFPQIRLIRHPINLGYGAAIKTGIRASSSEIIAWFDADGQHRVEDLLNVVSMLDENKLEYCFGIRGVESYEEPGRKLGKGILKTVVRFAAGRQVNDFNTGLRAFRRDVITKYLHLLPKRFGASTVTTLLMLERNHFGDEVPIIVRKRLGKSTVNQLRDGFRTLLLILRIFILFKPLHFFGFIGVLCLFTGALYGIIKSMLVGMGIPVMSSILLIFGFQSFFFGLLCDQISALRRDNLEF